ncbi:S66 peptidase family protein [Modicisalibacter luteus]|uniref:LD-carboxypeptidase n=1 Tax=Modicisalibacter luteus TaxID=453962 RepID=A0ABV7M613_9GAMM|nr:LD-carboxypeptidase [Halomonas lutea]
MSLSVSVVAPASHTDPRLVDDAVAALETLGIHAHVPDTLQAPHRYLAGSIQHRLDMLYAAYEDSRTEAIWAVRGGYGCAQLVEHVDWSRLPAKPLVGYSDITVLLDQCYRHGLPAIHGPVIKDALRLNHESSESRTPTRRQMLEVVDLVTGIKPTGLPLHRHANSTPETIAGPVVGGNLMTLACIAGTSCQFVAPPHALVILEDVGEPYYRLERALWQLVHSGALDQAGALCMGTFEGCTSYGEQSLAEIAAELISPLELPLFTELPVGHGLLNRPWRYGALGRIEGNTLEFPTG